MVRKCTGFRCLVSFGFTLRPVLLFVAYLLSGLLPRVAIFLLLRKCSLESADFVNVKVSGCIERECIHGTASASINLSYWCAATRWQTPPAQGAETVNTAFVCTGRRTSTQSMKRLQHMPYLYTCHLVLSLLYALLQSKVRSSPLEKQCHRVFNLSTQLYIFYPDLCAFLPLDDMPSDLPQQLWSAVTALKAIDNGTCLQHIACPMLISTCAHCLHSLCHCGLQC